MVEILWIQITANRRHQISQQYEDILDLFEGNPCFKKYKLIFFMIWCVPNEKFLADFTKQAVKAGKKRKKNPKPLPQQYALTVEDGCIKKLYNTQRVNKV